MTEQELLTLQQTSGHLYLMRVGQFYHAYDGAAFAMARVTGYKVRLKHRKGGDVHVLGFNTRYADQVLPRCTERGLSFRREDPEGRLLSFTGGDPTPDASLVTPPRPRQPSKPDKPSRAGQPATPSRGGSRRQRGREEPDAVRIYAKCVQLQHLSMSLLGSDIARTYRFTVLPELLRLATRMVELSDQLTLDFGEARMERARQIAVLTRTYQSTVGNLVSLHALKDSQEADVATLVEAIESEAKAAWWESYNKQRQDNRRNPPGQEGQAE